MVSPTPSGKASFLSSQLSRVSVLSCARSSGVASVASVSCTPWNLETAWLSSDDATILGYYVSEEVSDLPRDRV